MTLSTLSLAHLRLGLAIASLLLTPIAAWAQPQLPNTDPLRQVPLELNWLAQPPAALPPTIVTAATVAQAELTQPSLWWLRQQLEAQFTPRLVANWIAYPQAIAPQRRVDVLVNQLRWNELNYLRRYAFLHQFGTAVRDQGYTVRVFDERANWLGAYRCHGGEGVPTVLPSEPEPPTTTAAVPEPAWVCDVWLDTTGRGSWRGQSTNPFAAPLAAPPATSPKVP